METKTKTKTKTSEHKRPWQEVYASPEEIQQFLGDRVMLRYNVVTGRTEVHLCTDFGDDLQAPPEWLPFEVDSIESPLSTPFNHEGIYAQAYALYRQGFRYWFTQSEIERLAAHNKQYETANLELELVAQYFRKPVGKEPGEFISTAMAMQIVGANITQKLSKEMVSRAFTSLGFQSHRTSMYRGYVVVRRSPEEMRALRYRLAADQPGDDASSENDANDGNDANDSVF